MIDTGSRFSVCAPAWWLALSLTAARYPLVRVLMETPSGLRVLLDLIPLQRPLGINREYAEGCLLYGEAGVLASRGQEGQYMINSSMVYS